MLAVNLRAAITGLPPVFPELAASLHLSGATLAALAATPVLCFGVFSGGRGAAQPADSARSGSWGRPWRCWPPGCCCAAGSPD